MEAVLELLNNYGSEAKILAGGTDIIIALKDKMVFCKYLVDIKAVRELQNIEYSEEEGLSIGSAVCLNDVIENEFVNRNYCVLKEAAKTLANKTLRNRATLVGNICNSSPGGDMLPASLVLEGKAEIASIAGTRIVPLKDFFTGVKRNVLKENEMVTRIIYPAADGRGRFSKKSRIKGHDLAQISIAAYHATDGSLRVAVGAAGPTPIYMDKFPKYEKSELLENIDSIIDIIAGGIKPISDVRASKDYRMAMAKYLSTQILEELGGAVKC